MSVRTLLRSAVALLILAAALLSGPARAGVVPRTILALVDLREEEIVRRTRIHTLAEMPLNHLGLTVAYWNVADGLPDLARYPDLRGVITWFTNNPFPDPQAYVAWATAAMDRGVRFAVLGQPGVQGRANGQSVPLSVSNRFFARFGLRDDDGYLDLTYRSQPVVSDAMIGYERPLIGVLPGYALLRKIDGRTTSHLVMRRNGDPATDSHLVVTGPNGGYVYSGYGRYFDPEFIRSQWIIDPFAFFRTVFATDDLPKPDVTTVSGRRIYFSHIDGDGWRNVTELPPYAKDKVLAADVVRREAIEAFPDLPVTVAPIVGDVDAAWKGTPETRGAADRLFALPQVEPASHTWTHPFRWSFFQDYSPQKEAVFNEQGGGGPQRSVMDRLLRRERKESTYENVGEVSDIGRYSIPRAYLQEPFDLNQEIGGALDYFTRMAPAGKTAVLVQWPGDTSPFESAVAAVRKAGAHNMNGGDSRFDAEFPSITGVPPIGLPVGAERQIYSGNSNENTYTDLWSNRFFGFQNLINTVRNTDSPLRLKPFNIYYHMYSGQKAASVKALRRNLTAARGAEIAPIRASDYAAIAEGFYSARFVPEGERRWRVTARGALNTLRFDQASFTAVDLARSTGVLGQRHHQGSLYVALDPAVAEPVVALAEVERADLDPPADRPHLVQGRWVFSGLATDGKGFRVAAQGFGKGEMVWHAPAPGRYAVTAERGGAVLWQGTAEAGADRRLSVTVDADAIQPLTLRVQPAAR
ncbi:polysaccharide deacetylase family protein [Azospirillum sp. sgz302134]